MVGGLGEAGWCGEAGIKRRGMRAPAVSPPPQPGGAATTQAPTRGTGRSSVLACGFDEFGIAECGNGNERARDGTEFPAGVPGWFRGAGAGYGPGPGAGTGPSPGPGAGARVGPGAGPALTFVVVYVDSLAHVSLLDCIILPPNADPGAAPPVAATLLDCRLILVSRPIDVNAFASALDGLSRRAGNAWAIWS